MDNAVALLILKEYPRLQNRRKAKDLPLKMWGGISWIKKVIDNRLKQDLKILQTKEYIQIEKLKIHIFLLAQIE